jgi:pyruvate,water dikinase
MARQAVRSREETKSGLVAVTTRFKEAYRGLAQLLVAEGLLPDADAVFFLTHDELGRLARGSGTGLVAAALARRDAFAAQESYEFPDVFQGEPTRLDLDLEAGDSAGVVRGAPVSRGRVTGVARIVRSIDEASALQRGEILIAPITDVGWTPYFSLIAGLVTDIGSAVSHGAVVAREYGLPAVVNTRIATRVFSTGDRIVLDGESGIVRLADDDDPSAAIRPD